ncbi:metallophosphoesterase family protein [Ornithinibacillus halophilus]|uniref:Phosphoesterase n=1 Tax=Ornithinibacillus halophilus TaxID=930117 RepID=A0A1M5NA98_9BACI|nr:metallophosphoesterase [Ornithinibacillus halophilus]SHG86464.1 hypothetical protein SAMN05216225_10748 [Ornithinibacillus halophilus]
MNSVVIVSDSHGLTNELLEIKERHDPTYFIHCGDSELHPDSKELGGYIKVGGNCDFDPQFPDDQIVQVGDLTFYVTHGHLYNVKMNLMKLAYRAEEVQANVVCFGHSHVAGAEKIDQQLFINPGSIRMPRNRPDKTYAIVTWNTKEDISVTFYNTNGEVVEDMTYHTEL